MRSLTRVFILWLPIAITIVGVCTLIYATVQQNYRESLNDPQIQMAEDKAYDLGTTPHPDPATILPASTVDISLSLSPWLALVDPTGHTVDSSGMLDGSFPQFPSGVLQSASLGIGKDTAAPGEDRVTWQPDLGVRQAIVVVEITGGQYKGYFIVAGRTMREVEDRENSLETMIGISIVVLLLVSFIVKFLVDVILKEWI
jgi:hypothetical protein